MIQSTHNGSWDVAAQCFLNSLIRETKDWRLSQGEPAELVIPLAEEKALHFRVAYFSPTQHHRFAFPARLVTHRGSETVTFATVARLIVDKLQHQQQLPAPGCEAFYQRVMESHAHTAEATAARHDWRGLREKALNFAEAEQALLVGHAFHPAPKSHEPFTQQQAERYLPDFAPHFPLRWFAVDKDQLAGDSLQLTLQQRLTRFAAENAPQLLHALTDRQWLFPLHPWQADALLQQTWCQQLVEKGLVTDLGEAGATWLPTTSSRSLYCATSRDMIKFSLSVRLTNSVRTLSVKEVKRGMRLARLAQTERWQDMQARFPAFRVMQEDGWAGLRDAQGTIMEESLFALRENLIVDRPQSQTNVLVSLTQSAPDGGDSLLSAAVKRLSQRLHISEKQAAHAWVDAYCQQVLKPLFTAEADYGLVLLAHQQNILVEMEQDLPVGLIYRDCQGSAFMPHAAGWLDMIGEAQAENVFSREQLLRYFPYYLLVNSTFAVTAALGAAGMDSETHLMARVRDALSALRNEVTHKGCLDYVLESPHWNVKGNFFCYLHDHNENTIVDPSVIYFNFINPLLSQER
ncbi:N(2)-citryl-N(6)-acetyl-N(6)-hydroxylysine synthase [Pantoea ananatis]|uniref:aerobactin synthase IucA n=1 Tax=Pantoea ananas TaxID=553 RepID=UPI0021F7EDF8|nr:aerobactin synthase IucA [Pantoea ananatis]MCW0315318.1 N(2)-citryl-N(6)-acetyl-N(6)-hydroxylysine synthase [Pantoea ananatis]MCW0333113.1 N(2)-citryl-N(6)-acetyl-N(6)-hydroxylysine synthase [Pantoea ananatis]MCW0381637.1 N(2)-citryl-N(6)-acetyl-N(6)-hydroxylysine synthase [Pantoea ananatis]MCW0406302.1 N(2)-citryl-N(6)-acetyl-N(6)-hydroxylysine synthase [Pantoea ananatis]MCW0426476.1 N(2)-citryl-N(6)-acetyl-N(6)-hydroxylysine synthase [Pantoea ananatis]